ncbi:MAG: thioredoxin domain-containing protein [Clostridium sp.]|nr:thioredoxin domain-containing protein [Clostridium sp.]
MSNHLKNETSPYLLQHVNNPVDWYPWSAEAFKRAMLEDKPIFLSIGYSTCHWCHVMAHESFENEETAKILNQHFISIKVDREERPDIDSVYMAFCQTFTGSGGWPMSIFMTAEQKPFFAGTYFPTETQFGKIGFNELLFRIVEKWKNNREGLLQTAELLLSGTNTAHSVVESGIDERLPEQAAAIFSDSFDKRYGGFGRAPKFPTPHNLVFLILYAYLYSDRQAMEQAAITLDKMRRGGIFDHIGYGFSRYSTDDYFLIPHFEKMLYDNALMILAYVAAYKAMKKDCFLDTAEKTAEYIMREMTGKNGEFYSAQDADSEGEEGRFYLWDYGEVCNVLGDEQGKAFCDHFGITEKGNFEGKNIPNLLNGNEISDKFRHEIKKLYNYRKSRMCLHTDDKVLTSWNALMICAMSLLYRVSGKDRYLDAAQKAEAFLEKHLIKENIIYVSSRGGKLSAKGFLDDYVYYMAALICLYEVTSEENYLHRARRFCEEAKKQFKAENDSGYYLCGGENDRLISKPMEVYDGAMPSGNSVLSYCLVRLFQLTGDKEFKENAEEQLAFLSAKALSYPAGHSMFLLSLLFYLKPQNKITVVLSAKEDRHQILRELPLYAEVRIFEQETEEYRLLEGRTTYYVCQNHTCLPPTNQVPFSAEEVAAFGRKTSQVLHPNGGTIAGS